MARATARSRCPDHCGHLDIRSGEMFAPQAGFVGTAFNWTGVLEALAWGLSGLLAAIRSSPGNPGRG